MLAESLNPHDSPARVPPTHEHSDGATDGVGMSAAEGGATESRGFPLKQLFFGVAGRAWQILPTPAPWILQMLTTSVRRCLAQAPRVHNACV